MIRGSLRPGTWQRLGIWACLCLLLLPASAGRASQAPEPAPTQRLPAPNSRDLPQALTADPWVEDMIGQVVSSTLSASVGSLSGEWPVIIDGSPYTMTTRSTTTDAPIQEATEYAYDYFQSLGLATSFDTYTLYSMQKRNVIAEQRGLTQPGRIFLLTAHLDSTSITQPNTLAPGADDNASGASAVMLASDILSKYPFGCTLRYALFTGEEQGLIGSYAYARKAYARGDDIDGVLNLDMVGYNTLGSPATTSLHTRRDNNNNADDLAIANLFKDVTSTYNIGLIPSIIKDNESGSDHYPFWTKGYPGILAIEDDYDFNPDYHETSDTIDKLDLGYYTKFVKAAVGTFAHMGCLLEGEVDGTVTDAASHQPLPGATVQAWLGDKVAATATTQADGTYQLFLDPGTYRISISAHEHAPNVTEAFTAQRFLPATLDAVLQPCVPVEQVNFTFSPLRPELNETVVFTGTIAGGESPISWTWDFGDGGSDNQPITSHSYTSKGIFEARLTADNVCVAPASVKQKIYVGISLFYIPFLAKQQSP